MSQRQHPDELTAALGEQIVGAVVERLLDHALPAGEVKESAAWMSADEFVPLPLVTGAEGPHREAELRSVQHVTTGNGPLSLLRNS